MRAIAKLLSYPDKFLSIFFLTILPQILRLAILTACIFCKHYQIFITRRNYMSAVKNSSLRFHHRRELRPDSCECSVCLSDFEEGEECSAVAACGHAFHKGCLERWLKGYAPTCPLCRAAVVPEGIAEDYRRLEVEGEDDWIEKEFALVLLNALDGIGGRCNGFF